MGEELRRAARLAVKHHVPPENEIWYGAPTFRQAKRVMWERLKRVIPDDWRSGPPTETECSIRLRTGHRIRLVGLDRHDALRGSGLWFFGGDEWADCRADAWTQTIRPMLSTVRGHALFIGTPKGFDHLHEAYLRGVRGGSDDHRSFLFTTVDGGNVPPDEVERARSLLDPRSFRQEYEASFEGFAGRVIYGFSRAANVKETVIDLSDPVRIGLDFNINPMSATVWQRRNDILHQVDEIVMPTSNTDEMCREIVSRYAGGCHGGAAARSNIVVYPDPAGAQRKTSAQGRTDIGILKEQGFSVVAPASHPPVRDRINVMNAWFESAAGERRAFVDPRCTMSITAYERLVYRDGTSEPDKTTGHDHLVDATGYFMFAQAKANATTARRPTFSMGR